MSASPAPSRRHALSLALLLACAGCGPVYETGYRLEPPPGQDAATRQCLATCQAARDTCLPPAQAQFENCDTMASLAQDQCRNRSQINYMICQSAYARDGATCSYQVCERRMCQPTAIQDCEAAYRGCFAGCGGTVVEEPRCVANCPS
jgi:hypothetical protein